MNQSEYRKILPEESQSDFRIDGVSLKADYDINSKQISLSFRFLKPALDENWHLKELKNNVL